MLTLATIAACSLGEGALDPADQLLAAVGLHVDVDVGHAAPVGVEEALEEQVVVRCGSTPVMPQQVGDQAVGGAAPPADADAHVARGAT